MAKQATTDRKGACILWDHGDYYRICDAKNRQYGAGVCAIPNYHPSAVRMGECLDCGAVGYKEEIGAVLQMEKTFPKRCPDCERKETERKALEAERKKQEEEALNKRKAEAKKNNVCWECGKSLEDEGEATDHKAKGLCFDCHCEKFSPEETEEEEEEESDAG